MPGVHLNVEAPGLCTFAGKPVMILNRLKVKYNIIKIGRQPVVRLLSKKLQFDIHVVLQLEYC